MALDPSTLVGTVALDNGPRNSLDRVLLEKLLCGLHELAEAGCRAVVLVSRGAHFCAGADVLDSSAASGGSEHLYDRVPELFDQPLPLVAAVQGAAVGGGLGLALVADFRVASTTARFSVNFARLGFHHGFALTVTLPALVGQQRAAEMLMTGLTIRGEEARQIGLCDRLVPLERLETEATALAAEIAMSAPLAVARIRRTLRSGLRERVQESLAHERSEQEALMATADFREGLRALRDRRTPIFNGV